MFATVVRIRIMVLLVLVLASVVVWLPGAGGASSGQPARPVLTVTFFDVGQGDATYIATPDGVQVLIDGGVDGAVLRHLAGEMSWLDRDLDLVVGTHPDLDHVGGLVDVLERFSVAAILTTEAEGASFAANSYVDRVTQEGANVVMARAGQEFQLGASTTLRVLAPARDPSMLESNAGSIILQLQYGETEFMLTGDAPKGVENYLVGAFGADLESEVLKLGHHGSDTSSSQLFLNTVDPEFAIVSAGANNRYGHPHAEVLQRARAAGAQILSTAAAGSITFYSDGQNIWLEN